MDGMEVCRRIRAWASTRILMLTARQGEEDRIEGLELGADDYLVKPFSPREVVSRVKAILRRTTSVGAQSSASDASPGGTASNVQSSAPSTHDPAKDGEERRFGSLFIN